MLVDSHVHLDMPQFAGELDGIVERAISVGVGEMLNVGYDPRSIEETLGLADMYDCVHAALGIHPHNAKDYSEDLEKRLKKVLLRGKVLAVGEIGLDYYRDLSPREVQRDVFRRQIGLALYFGKPMVVHCREAFGDLIDILKEEGAGEVGGIFHAFSGGVDEALEVLKLGFLVGVGGPLTYRNSKLPGVVSQLPSSSFVLETDSPYLPPVPYRGKRNEPAYVRLVAEKLVEVLGVTFEDIERATEVNYRFLLHGDRDFPSSIAYMLKGNVYVNVTGTCTNDCTFCPRHCTGNFLYGHNLDLISDPSVEEMGSAVRGILGEDRTGEIVFCGYGEPTTRIDDIIETARSLKDLGMPIRLNSNGQGNMINQRNIVPQLEGVFDMVSVSLNAPDADTYLRLCRPDAGVKAFDAVLDFLRKAAASRLKCEATALDFPGTDIDACRTLVESIPGASFRARRYHITVCEE